MILAIPTIPLPQVMHVLMRQGANPHLTTPGDRSALDLAFEGGRFKALLEVLPIPQIFRILAKIDAICPASKEDEKESGGDSEAPLVRLPVDQTEQMRKVCSESCRGIARTIASISINT